MKASNPEPLVGRAHERSVLADAIAGAGGRPVVLVHGDAGIGKSALLEQAVADAERDGVRVLRAAGVALESNLPFAGLHQLLRPLLDATVTETSQRAVLAAFEAPEAAGAALFRTAMAVLELLADASSSQRLVVVVDDVQWFDRPSRDVVTFVGRRLGIDPVSLVLGARDPVPDELHQAAAASGWRVLHVGPLDETESAALLDAFADGLDPGVRTMILEEAAGSPLA